MVKKNKYIYTVCIEEIDEDDFGHLKVLGKFNLEDATQMLKIISRVYDKYNRIQDVYAVNLKTFEEFRELDFRYKHILD